MNTEMILEKVSQHIEVKPGYKYYLERKVLDGFKKEINEEKIIVESEGTVFVNRQIDKLIELKEIEEKVSQLRKLAKKKNCKLKGVNNSIKEVRENYSDYKAEVENAQELFKSLVAGWTDYEIHDGYSEDTYYNHYLRELEYALQKAHYMNTLLMEYRAFVWNINKKIKELQSENNYSKINVYF